MQFKNLYIIGTSHISKHSVQRIREHILINKPDIVAVELDKNRLASLEGKEKGKITWEFVRKIGVKGTLFALIGSYVQKKLGKLVGVMPGSDMLEAVKTAKKIKAKVKLIDQNIEITLARFSFFLSRREKWNFFVDFFRAIFFRKREMKRLGLEKIDLTKVPPKTLIKKLAKEIKKRYPNIYRVLIYERNVIMANRLAKLMLQYPSEKILAVIGAGHEDEMLAMVKKINKKLEPGTTYEFSF